MYQCCVPNTACVSIQVSLDQFVALVTLIDNQANAVAAGPAEEDDSAEPTPRAGIKRNRGRGKNAMSSVKLKHLKNSEQLARCTPPLVPVFSNGHKPNRAPRAGQPVEDAQRVWLPCRAPDLAPLAVFDSTAGHQGIGKDELSNLLGDDILTGGQGAAEGTGPKKFGRGRQMTVRQASRVSQNMMKQLSNDVVRRLR